MNPKFGNCSSLYQLRELGLRIVYKGINLFGIKIYCHQSLESLSKKKIFFFFLGFDSQYCNEIITHLSWGEFLMFSMCVGN